MLERIDGFLFDKIFQPISDSFSDRTGRTPHWIAATFGYIYGAVIVWYIVAYPPASWISYTWQVLLLFFAAQFILESERNDKKQQLGFANQYRSSTAYLVIRMLCLPLIIGNILFLFTIPDTFGKQLTDFLRVFSFTCILYFGACETKPPAPPKRKESLQTATAKT